MLLAASGGIKRCLANRRQILLMIISGNFWTPTAQSYFASISGVLTNIRRWLRLSAPSLAMGCFCSFE